MHINNLSLKRLHDCLETTIKDYTRVCDCARFDSCVIVWGFIVVWLCEVWYVWLCEVWSLSIIRTITILVWHLSQFWCSFSWWVQTHYTGPTLVCGPDRWRDGAVQSGYPYRLDNDLYALNGQSVSIVYQCICQLRSAKLRFFPEINCL